MAESCKAKHVQIPSKKHKKEIFNIQLINYYHSSLKGMTNIRFRGVATKYLNNYIVYNNFVTFAKESFMEKIKILKNEIFTFRVEKRSYSRDVKFKVETGAFPGWSHMVIDKGALVNIRLKG